MNSVYLLSAIAASTVSVMSVVAGLLLLAARIGRWAGAAEEHLTEQDRRLTEQDAVLEKLREMIEEKDK